jgi:hypothetical protein
MIKRELSRALARAFRATKTDCSSEPLPGRGFAVFEWALRKTIEAAFGAAVDALRAMAMCQVVTRNLAQTLQKKCWERCEPLLVRGYHGRHIATSPFDSFSCQQRPCVRWSQPSSTAAHVKQGPPLTRTACARFESWTRICTRKGWYELVQLLTLSLSCRDTK